MTNNIKEESYIENEIINKIKNIERRAKKYPPTRSIILELIKLKESQQLAKKIKPYTREEYLEITKRQKPVDVYVPYAEARGLDFPQYHRHFSMSDLLLFKLNWA